MSKAYKNIELSYVSLEPPFMFNLHCIFIDEMNHKIEH